LWNGAALQLLCEEAMNEARTLIELIQARKGLITVLTRRLEQHDELLAKIAAAELRHDPDWRAFTKSLTRYKRLRKNLRRKRGW
jgi:hypothetical protein